MNIDKWKSAYSQKLSVYSDWVIGLSGGVDSVVLLDLCTQLRQSLPTGINLHAVHINHQTRGKDSDRDEAFCRTSCQEAGVNFHSQSLDVEALARANGQNFEEAARQVRHKIFGDYIQQKKLTNPVILLAHHYNDQVETIIMRLLRQSGLRGLQGIREQLNLPDDRLSSRMKLEIIRPLLNIRKDEIIAYASEHNLTWYEDKSNMNTDYTRNLIRNVIIPTLDLAGINYQSPLQKLSALAADVENCLDSEYRQIKIIPSILRPCITVESARKAGFSPFCRAVEELCALLHSGFLLPNKAYPVLQKVFTGEQAATDLGANLHLYEYRGKFYVFDKDEPLLTLSYCHQPDGFSYENKFYRITITRTILQGSLPQAESRNIEYIPLDYASELLELRLPTPRDQLLPLGLAGTQSSAKLLKNHHVPQHIRAKIPILWVNNTPLWVAGITLCQAGKLTEPTGEVFCLEYSEKTF